VVIDFIDMKRETNNKAVMERLVECLRQDKARMEVGKINRFGVLVMTRQRIRPSIQHVTHETCPVCHGTGQVKNAESVVLSVLRRLKSVLLKNGVLKLGVRLAPSIALGLLNQKRQDLAELETAHGVTIVVTPDHDVIYGEIAMDVTRKEEEPESAKRPDAQGRREQVRDTENETVVLGGDAPISFEKALDDAEEGDHSDRRAAQRAALDERERLRTIFEGQKDKEAPKDAGAAPQESKEFHGHKKSRHRRKTAAAAKEPSNSGAVAPQVSKDADNAPAHQKTAHSESAHGKPQHHSAPVRQIEPPKLSPEVVASLTIPTKPQKLSALPVQAPQEPKASTPSATAKGVAKSKASSATTRESKVSASATKTKVSAGSKASTKPSAADEAVKETKAPTGKSSKGAAQKVPKAASSEKSKAAKGEPSSTASKGRAKAEVTTKATKSTAKPKASGATLKGNEVAPSKVSKTAAAKSSKKAAVSEKAEAAKGKSSSSGTRGSKALGRGTKV